MYTRYLLSPTKNYREDRKNAKRKNLLKRRKLPKKNKPPLFFFPSRTRTRVVPDVSAGSARNYSAKESAEKYLKHCPESLDNKHLSNYDLIIAMEPHLRDAILSKSSECENKTVVRNNEDP